MPLSREIRKFLGRFCTDPRLEERLSRLQKEVDFLYAYLDLKKGERQYARTLAEVRPDHLKRYEFAASRIERGVQVVDAACGIGYGSFLIGERAGASVTGIDISQQALQIADKYWTSPNTRFLHADCTQTGLPAASFDVAVSFETIEHVPVAPELVAHLYALLKPGGHLICSTPNEAVIPHSAAKYPHHQRHYTLAEIKSLLTAAGFAIESIYTQAGSGDQTVVPGDDGKYLILIAIKPRP